MGTSAIVHMCPRDDNAFLLLFLKLPIYIVVCTYPISRGLDFLFSSLSVKRVQYRSCVFNLFPLCVLQGSDAATNSSSTGGGGGGGVGSGGGGVGGGSGASTVTSTRGSSRSRSSEEPHIGKYKLLKTIGKGNFAKVKLAKHVPTGKEVNVIFVNV